MEKKAVVLSVTPEQLSTRGIKIKTTQKNVIRIVKKLRKFFFSY
jgi:hypothetical protein